MDPISSINPASVRIMDYIYFSAGISVIALGGIGTIFLILGILKIKYLKPFKNKYPYEKFKSFDEFASKKPATPDGIPISREVFEMRKNNHNKPSHDTQQLTWENAPDEIGSLTAQELKSINKLNQIKTRTSKPDKTHSQHIEQTEELVVD
ncbi:hypothetical protein KKB99_00630 [bacterium]|nr:hypothetical protein [bacterium]MBU1024491.1 hypothetical protein [bacterium]